MSLTPEDASRAESTQRHSEHEVIGVMQDGADFYIQDDSVQGFKVASYGAFPDWDMESAILARIWLKNVYFKGQDVTLDFSWSPPDNNGDEPNE